MRRVVQALHAAGAGLLPGSDLPNRPAGVHAELAALVRAGLTPAQREGFDAAARLWLREQARAGVRVAIPGVTPVP